MGIAPKSGWVPPSKLSVSNTEATDHRAPIFGGLKEAGVRETPGIDRGEGGRTIGGMTERFDGKFNGVLVGGATVRGKKENEMVQFCAPQLLFWACGRGEPRFGYVPGIFLLRKLRRCVLRDTLRMLLERLVRSRSSGGSTACAAG